jgi:hypothetical protein
LSKAGSQTYVTYHLMYAGKVVWTNYAETQRTAQEYAECIAASTSRTYADEVHVFLGGEEVLDSRQPDAIAQVTAW